jgi:hypothetical protein
MVRVDKAWTQASATYGPRNYPGEAMPPSILPVLRAEHELLRALQDRLLQTSGDTGLRDQLWYRLKSELRSHARAEEIALYKDLMDIDESAHRAAHSVKEHRAMEEVVDQLDHLGFDQPSWLLTLKRLVHMSNHHLDEEESELFPLAGRVLSDTAKADCTTRYRNAKLAYLVQEKDSMARTTSTGRDDRTLDALSVEELRDRARRDGLSATGSRSELVSALRGAPSVDA